MKKIILLTVAMAMFIALPLSSALAVEVFSAETETRIYDPEKSYGGYVMPTQSKGPQTVYLLDMMGNVVHKWDNVGGSPKLLPDGILGSMCQLMDWDGNVLWSYDPMTDSQRDLGPNHDGRFIWNTKLNQYTFLVKTTAPVTEEEIVAAGGDPDWDYSKRLIGTLTNDGVIEVNMNKEIVWEWHAFDHTVQSKNPAWPNYVSDVALAPGRLDAHFKSDMMQGEGPEGISNYWLCINSLDYNEELDHVLVNSKAWGTFFVIDHGNTFVSTTDFAANAAAAAGPDGDFLYRFGSPASCNQGLQPGLGTSGHTQLSGAHDVQWIRPYHWERPHPEAGDEWPDPATVFAETMPGVGHLLLFDNACYSTIPEVGSRILELNQYLNAEGVDTGDYVNPPEAGYKRTTPYTYPYSIDFTPIYLSNQIVWSFQSKKATCFYNFATSGVQRLPNGNTNVAGGTQGHIFEVTPEGEVVWDYLYPGVPTIDSPAVTIKKDAGFGAKGRIFRAYRYGEDYPGLAGKDLTPMGTITGRIPRLVGEDQMYPTTVPITGWGIPPGTTGTVGGKGGY